MSEIYFVKYMKYVWLHSSVGRATHRQRGGHRFESRWSPDFFQASSFQLLKLENLLRWSFFTLEIYFVSLRTADVSPRSSPLKDVSRGGTSATQRQKFHTDDEKSDQNPVRSANWSTEQFHCSSHCLQMTTKDKRRQRSKYLTKQSICVEYGLHTTLFQNRPGET